MDIDSSTGLVLEGGGMRAIFTVGVLDCFMDHDIWFPYTIGVSAGASNGISYASRQRGRSRFSNIDLLEKYDYIGFRHFLRGRGYIDMKYLFYIYPEKYYPLDYETYFKSPNRFVMVTSNCLTGALSGGVCRWCPDGRRRCLRCHPDPARHRRRFPQERDCPDPQQRLP